MTHGPDAPEHHPPAPTRAGQPEDAHAGVMADKVSDAVTAVSEAVAAVKAKLRGWLHAGTFPLVVASGIVLIALAPSTRGRITATVFTVTAALLFGTSAVYHRG